MTQINAYLHFDGNCREAMDFYRDCLGGDLTVITVGDSPMAKEWPAEKSSDILHSRLQKNGIVLMGSDMGCTGKGAPSQAVSLSLSCSSREELEGYFSSLSSGGEVTHPIHDFFAGTMGAITDRFGKNWMFYYGPESAE